MVHYQEEMKKKKRKLVKNTLFSDTNEEGKVVSEKKATELRIKALQKKAEKKAKAEQNVALSMDPTVFEYDKIHEKIKKEEPEKEEKESKYIKQLKKNAEDRKFLYERAKDRMAHAEQLLEEKTKGKVTEVFVTSAYKKRLKERQGWEKEEQRKLEQENDNDVKKIGNLGNFYSRMLNKLSRDEKEQVKEKFKEDKHVLKEEKKMLEESENRIKVNQQEAIKERIVSDKLDKIISKQKVKTLSVRKISSDVIAKARLRALARKNK
eukprot:snap_masked-scaffold_3-processed-gene-20.28-mRNA-1 protein AED:1.00 eAED:1.00 QI:0/-1/0/0/-1/1/1/0/264